MRLRRALPACELVADPVDCGFRDAHWNIACLYERMGKPAAALRQLRLYRQLSRGR